jgi:hypothetical protein
MQGSFREAVGLWEPDEGRIVVKRSQLASVEQFAGAVLHEVAHAVTDAGDATVEFEEALTREIGNIVARLLGSTGT